MQEIVDDDASIILKLTRKTLLRLEHVQRVDGAKGLALVEVNTYDLVITDLEMPIMDGYELTENIRKLNGPKQTTNIIIRSANDTPEDRYEATRRGADGFVTKPIDSKKLTIWICVHCCVETRNLSFYM